MDTFSSDKKKLQTLLSIFQVSLQKIVFISPLYQGIRNTLTKELLIF